MAAEVPQTLEYRDGQLNAAPMLMVENFTNWKKRVMCHIVAGQSKAKGQWTCDKRKAANLDPRLKSLIFHDDEEDTRDSQEYLNDLEEEFQERVLLAKSKRFFKKGSPRFSSAKANDKALIPLVGPLECDIRTMISGVKDHEVRILLAFDACGCKGRDTKENTWRSLSGSTSYVDSKPRKSSSPIIENNSLKVSS
ncbi:hypothetical protein Tco_1311315 [Tanacetum coccineum]